MNIRPVILSGGSGTRMWPVSRAKFPKQFAELYGDISLFARTLQLIADRKRFEAPIIVANQDHKFLILDMLARLKINDATILLEPVGRNTGAAAIVAAIAEREKVIHLVMPSDHVINDAQNFLARVDEAKAAAAEGQFVLFGMKPDRPETGFGYILPDTSDAKSPVKHVARFLEKPAEDRARELIKEGALWNSGIFVYAPDTLSAEAEQLAPQTLELCTKALRDSTNDLGCVMLAAEPYMRLANEPIDRLIMEKTKKASVIACDFKWSDVGSWQTLWLMSEKDANNTTAIGPVVSIDAQSSYLRSYGPELAVLGVDNLAVVATKDAVLVAPLSRAQELRELVGEVSKNNNTLGIEHPRVSRPWGSYEGIANGARFQVKQIVVLPGRSLSLQKHHHRAEHWVVVAGTAKIECDGVEKLLYPNESHFIPIGAIHRLSNPGLVDLHLIEVQSGDYVGEDDIVRYADNYGRTDKTNTVTPIIKSKK
jgi:mannose-1-phosphate guanylyltransferase / mannose-6-phosphate isomerase